MKRPDSPLVALAVGALGSGAANVAWTWENGPVRVAAGLFATALVPVSLHLWPRVPVTGWPTRAIRALVMTYICLAAAIVNLVHALWLLTGHPNHVAEDATLAFLAITAVEALMVMASLARRNPAEAAAVKVPAKKPGAVRSPEQSRRATAPTPDAATAPPAPTPKSKSKKAAPEGKRAAGLEWARDNWPVKAPEISMKFGVSRGEAYRIWNTVRDEQEAAS